jgi:hypothetical protein
MGIQFSNDWNVADPYYVRQYGEYQAFLDSFNKQQIMQALWSAAGHFSHPWVDEILNDALSSQGTHDVIIEQGTHQTESLRSGGFTLHFTMRNDRGRAYHLYVKQRTNGSLYINEVSWMDRGVPKSDFYR